ncbi:chaplin family protein [Bailinhaonella thermotolerans]|uniref:DUF320 domain-containing protein n=1 Tax=Bailinhaonella thermotolerans TaxID=1070861 RepID=A0A3A4AMT9_9ACTN|nr:chaplin family protein [Bailinhaonella thermotolerans]RJL22563.1 DUF320 domain-containing protein [Bailinhaonella thermotolerans]
MLKKLTLALAAGGLMILAAPANADITSGTNSLLGGNQILNDAVNVPVNVCGNSVAVFGQATAGCKGGAHVDTDDDRH